MYPIYKKTKVSVKKAIPSDDCFAQKAKNWLWILGIIVVGIVIFSIIKFPGLNAITPPTIKSVKQYVKAQNVAFVKNISRRGMLIKELAMEVNKLTDKRGVIIHSVYGGGSAQRAGLDVGDIIVRFNSHRVKNLKQFQSLIAQARPKSDVKIQVIRNGRKIKSIIRIGEGEMEGVTTQGTPAAWLPGRPYPWCYRR